MNHPATPSPPGRTTVVTAERVLVFAPHQDDELLGCGGLLRQLVDSGAKVQVAFLSDGAGGVEGDSLDQDQYSATRAEEADAVADYGNWTALSLKYRDGDLANQLGELESSFSDLIADFAPDLILVPSPFERTPDHVAAFDALFALLSRVRAEDSLYSLTATCRFFLYSINHPGYPNLLVDVSSDLDWLRDGMALYASQLAHHNYTAAGIGIRHYRSHSLPTSVDAAEGYTKLTLSDFTTNSRSTLLAAIDPSRSSQGGVAARDLTISLIVRTFNRPQWLREALESVAHSHLLPTEVVVVNDGGSSPRALGILDDLPLSIVEVDLETNQGRSAAANAGVQAASSSHLCFLDDDDIVFPEHFQVLSAAASAAGVGAAYSDAAVATYELSGPKQRDGRDGGGWVCMQRALPYSRDFDTTRLLVDNYIPFHTLIVERGMAQGIQFDEALSAFEDWDFLIRLSENEALHHVRQTTCEYRHFLGSGHHALGALTDEARSFLDAKAKVLAKHQDKLTPELLSRAVAGIRRESVELAQQVADVQARWESDRLGRADAVHQLTTMGQKSADFESKWRLSEDRYHREHGEVELLRKEEKLHLRHKLELEDEISSLREVVEEHAEHLGRTYAEIERLMANIETMENTKAWRLHKFFHRSES